ncbi:MAG: hypothetical protein MUQ51_02090 [Pseudomonadota bacterium]|nr:hypothetical protein [Pseudomonadota bacterium]MDO7710401.1 hypothetical protein [Pseudomonadota bacterium]
MMRYSFIGLCLLMVFSSANAETSIKEAEADELMSLSYRDADISEIYEALSRQNKVNILLASGVAGQVSLNLYDVTLDDAIHIIASAGGFAVQQRKSSYIITLQDNVGKSEKSGLTEVRSFKVQYSDVTDVEKILQTHLSRYGSLTSMRDRKMLIVEDQPEFLDQIEMILKEIDRAPLQILIEAKILDITLTDDDEYGIDWTQTSSDRTFGITGATGPSSGGFFTLLNNNIDLKLSALSKKGRTRTLSTPKLLALENHKASVIIGKKLGFKTTTTTNQITTETVEFIDSGIILTVTPSIDNSGRILLDIQPEVSDGTLTDGIPQLTTTSVKTQLLAEDGQPVFIGGLIKVLVSESTAGIPILSDIPLLGRLFSNDIDGRTNTETVVIITPHIIRTESERMGFTSPANFAELDRVAGESAVRVNQKLNQQVDLEYPTRKNADTTSQVETNKATAMVKYDDACKLGFIINSACR